ncbi:MAG: hypothetical protein AAF637_24960 [Pseudomonadota bacterium]
MNTPPEPFADQRGLQAKGPIAVMHGLPWRYDTHVPIIFAGPGIPNLRVDRPVATTDVAVTLSNLFGVSQPSAASGSVLAEIAPMTGSKRS